MSNQLINNYSYFNQNVNYILDRTLKRDYKKYVAEAKDKPGHTLMEHQFIVVNYILNHTNSRGCLIYHHMGLGKTTTANHLSKMLNPRNNVVVIAPRSVRHQFERANKKIIFADIRSTTLVNNLRSNYNKVFEDSVVIIDEAQMFFKGVVNGTGSAMGIYEELMRTRYVKIIFLSGTPISGHPACISVFINLLTRKEYLPISKTHFDILFINKLFEDSNNPKKLTKVIIKNKKLLQNLVYGYVSFYRDKIAIAEKFPKELPTQLVNIPMSKYQYSQYVTIRNHEIEYKRPRTKSQMASNFLIEDEKRDFTSIKKFPKFVGMAYVINKRHSNHPGYIFSQFVETSGLNDFGRYLEENHNYTNITDITIEEKKGGKPKSKTEPKKTKTKTKSKSKLTFNTKPKNYCIIAGSTSDDNIDRLKKLYNQKENADGSLLHLVLLGPVGNVGISLKRSRFVMFMNPLLDIDLAEQIKARAIRLNSSEDLLKKDRNVQPYIFISKIPKGIKTDIISTDEYLYEKGQQQGVINRTFLKEILEETSIDCPIHSDDPKTCYSCNSNYESLLYSTDDGKPIIECDDEKAPIVKKKFKILKKSGDLEEILYLHDKEADHTIVYIYNPTLKNYTLVNPKLMDYELIMAAVNSKLPSKKITEQTIKNN